MDALRRMRTQEVREDAAEGSLCFVPEPYEDALDHSVRFHQTWPDWHCDCGTHNAGREGACGYCGAVREDIDGLA